MKVFRDLQSFVDSGKEAIVFYGVLEADTSEEYTVLNAITGMWQDAEIIPRNVRITDAFTITTIGGRKDFVVPFIKEINVGKLTLWRIQVWGATEAGWASDYVVNYANQHYGPIYRIKEMGGK
jgi:hypothetical protein